uniref:Uncharacterized protein n=1 Tax=Arundo donax TaxID=35708 RepID=A0A0A8XZF1_ARUDO
MACGAGRLGEREAT